MSAVEQENRFGRRLTRLLGRGSAEEIAMGLISILVVNPQHMAEQVTLPGPVWSMLRALTAAHVYLRDHAGKSLRWVNLNGSLKLEAYTALSEFSWLNEEHRDALNAYLESIGVDEDVRGWLAARRLASEQGAPVEPLNAVVGSYPAKLAKVLAAHENHMQSLSHPEVYRAAETRRRFYRPDWLPTWELGIVAAWSLVAWQWTRWMLQGGHGPGLLTAGLLMIALLAGLGLVGSKYAAVRPWRLWLARMTAWSVPGLLYILGQHLPSALSLAGLFVPTAVALMTWQEWRSEEQQLVEQGRWQSHEVLGWVAILPFWFSAGVSTGGSIDYISMLFAILGAAAQISLIWHFIRRSRRHYQAIETDEDVELKDIQEAQLVREASAVAEQEKVPAPLQDEYWPSVENA